MISILPFVAFKIAFLNKQLVEEEFGQQFERKERILEQKLRRKKEC